MTHGLTDDQLIGLLRRHGRKVTAQRLAVAQALAAQGGHATAEEVAVLARAAVPGVSLTTVYTILHELVALGAARRVDFGEGTARFDPNPRPHAHLVCRRCRRAEDLPPTDYAVGLPPVAARGYRDVDYELLFLGLCPACQADEAAGAAPRPAPAAAFAPAKGPSSPGLTPGLSRDK
jgi:Fe2+ or Zn2+ uptake regulation protein